MDPIAELIFLGQLALRRREVDVARYSNMHGCRGPAKDAVEGILCGRRRGSSRRHLVDCEWLVHHLHLVRIELPVTLDASELFWLVEDGLRRYEHARVAVARAAMLEATRA